MNPGILCHPGIVYCNDIALLVLGWLVLRNVIDLEFHHQHLKYCFIQNYLTCVFKDSDYDNKIADKDIQSLKEC